MYALELSEYNRVLSITQNKYAPKEYPRVESTPEGDIIDYRYENNEFIYDPIPKHEPIKSLNPSQLDVLEAQVTYTAMMTDTLLEV